MARSDEARNLAEKLNRMGLATPVALLLRTFKPLAPALGQGLLFLDPFFGPGRLQRYADLFEDEESLEAFLNLLER